ncbi:MAG TPA: hypothetical protein VD865_11720 [Stenotrophomonas sp.]|nr:hypothetical protein [Stenotrophomonas sp.]
MTQLQGMGYASSVRSACQRLMQVKPKANTRNMRRFHLAVGLVRVGLVKRVSIGSRCKPPCSENSGEIRRLSRWRALVALRAAIDGKRDSLKKTQSPPEDAPGGDV